MSILSTRSLAGCPNFSSIFCLTVAQTSSLRDSLLVAFVNDTSLPPMWKRETLQLVYSPRNGTHQSQVLHHWKESSHRLQSENSPFYRVRLGGQRAWFDSHLAQSLNSCSHCSHGRTSGCSSQNLQTLSSWPPLWKLKFSVTNPIHI